MKLEYTFDLEKTDPEVVMELPLSDIAAMSVSIGNREKRNRSNYYQRKHIMGVQATVERSEKLAALNVPINVHFSENLGVPDVSRSEERFLAVGAADITANLFRPGWQSDVPGGRRLFHLEDEPINEKEYYAFMVTHKDGKSAANIRKIRFRGETPLMEGAEIPHLQWLLCSSPLVYNGEIVDKAEMAKHNYDLRHMFGREKDVGIINTIYKRLADGYDSFTRAIDENRDHILTRGADVDWYHAGIGIEGDRLIVIHHIGSMYQLAERFRRSGVRHAVLLDSGGSSIIWANWNVGGTLAHHWYYRPNRGAIIAFRLKGKCLRR